METTKEFKKIEGRVQKARKIFNFRILEAAREYIKAEEKAEKQIGELGKETKK